MATFTRLRSGDWGIRGTLAECTRGRVLSVTNSSGQTSRVRVTRRIWDDRTVAIAAVEFLRAGTDVGREEAPPSGPRVTVQLLAPIVRPAAAVETPIEPEAPKATPTGPTAEEIALVAKRQPAVIYTDVPEASGMPNPSAFFRRRGMVRVAWSDWAVPYDRIPWTRLNEYREKGCNMVPIRIDLRDVEAFINKLRHQCRQELEQRFKNINTAIDGCEKDGQAGYVTADLVRSKMATAEGRIRKLMESLDAASKLFGIDLYSSRDVANRLKVVGNRAELKAKAYVAGVKMLETVDAGLAKAARADEMEPGVLFDRLEDAGLETAGLRDAFRDDDGDEEHGSWCQCDACSINNDD